jgi:sulfate adenylyltransferase
MDNRLSALGGVMVGRVAIPQEAKEQSRGRPGVAVRDQITRVCVNIAHGFFSPLVGFMGQADVHAVFWRMTLTSG